MVRYLRLDEWLGEDAPLPFARSLVEVREDGWVGREIGLDRNGRVVYKYPTSNLPRGFRGICDMVTFDDGPDDLTKAEFEAYWSASLDAQDQARSVQAIRGPSLRERLWGLPRHGH